MYERFKDQGLVLIGVHTNRGHENMEQYVRDQEIPYPVAWDTEGETISSFAVDSFPDYYAIDRSGKVRIADMANRELDRVIETLLAEPPPNPDQASTDDIRRERRGELGPAKQRMEGRTAPPLRVSDWMNIEGEELKLQDLNGKVVLLNFWATW